ncbi:PaaI family thioesterase [Marinobacterium sp. YM272]|uniref:PaaI family thioesterase n=1 Tax=Marinobacterium sp. YM272 TaxID=3421654 RepID=UPI003D7FA5C4
MSVISVEALRASLGDHFPQGSQYGELESVADGEAVMRLTVSDQHLRPGGTVSGPVMMGLADVAIFFALQTRTGIETMAVTSSLNINFLSKPAADRDLLCHARMLKVGKRLAVGEAYLSCGDEADPVAHVTATYVRPGA